MSDVPRAGEAEAAERVTCIACAHATLKPQRWEKPGVMRGWLRCLRRADNIGLYLSPQFRRECSLFAPIDPGQLPKRLEAVR